MGADLGKCIEYYYGEYKKGGIFGKKYNVRFGIYPTCIEGTGFGLYDNELSNDTFPFEISYDDIQKLYVGTFGKETALFIEYTSNSVVINKTSIIILLGMDDIQRYFKLVENTKNTYMETKRENRQHKLEYEEALRKEALEEEKNAREFYQKCYAFHIRESTPSYRLFSDENKVALIYIDEHKALNFLKIDGYAKEENNGVIAYENIHYYEKAGNISYITDIHGNYSSYGGSMTGGKFSKLATVGGGFLFGLMGMALGTALTYKPSEEKEKNVSVSIDSDVKTIDDRSVILNFYSEMKKQYIDIELPKDIFNFFQTYLPEKKFGIVDELEKKTIVHQSTDAIRNGSLLKVAVKPDNQSIDVKGQSLISMDEFKQKVEKLKIMKEAGLLSEEKFAEEQEKLLRMI